MVSGNRFPKEREEEQQYEAFVSSVLARAGRPRDETEALVPATLRVLAERLTAGEAHHLRAQLPGENWMEEL